MAVTAATTVTDSPSVKVLKFVALDTKSTANETAVISKGDYNYAVIYAVANDITSPTGAGEMNLRAVQADGTSDAAIRGFIRSDSGTNSGDITAEEDVLLMSSGGSLVGRVVTNLPVQFKIVVDDATAGTAYDIDLYVELHK